MGGLRRAITSPSRAPARPVTSLVVLRLRLTIVLIPHARLGASPARTTEIVATVTARTSSAATARCAHLAHLVRRRASPAKTMEIVATMMSAGTCTAAAARFVLLLQPQIVWPLVRFALRRALAVKSSNAVEGALAINCMAMATLAPPEGLESPSRPCDRLEEAE